MHQRSTLSKCNCILQRLGGARPGARRCHPGAFSMVVLTSTCQGPWPKWRVLPPVLSRGMMALGYLLPAKGIVTAKELSPRDRGAGQPVVGQEGNPLLLTTSSSSSSSSSGISGRNTGGLHSRSRDGDGARGRSGTKGPGVPGPAWSSGRHRHLNMVGCPSCRQSGTHCIINLNL